MITLLLTACPRPDAQNSQNTGQQVKGVTVHTKLLGKANVGKAVFEVSVTKNNQALSQAQVIITGDMTHAGMTTVITEATEQTTGLYLTEDFEFTMAGDWIITTEVKLPSGQKVTNEIPVQVVR